MTAVGKNTFISVAERDIGISNSTRSNSGTKQKFLWPLFLEKMNAVHIMNKAQYKNESYLVGIRTDKLSLGEKIPGYISHVKVISFLVDMVA